MLVRETSPDAFTIWRPDQRVNGLLLPPNCEALWSDDELASLGLYRMSRFVAPAGKRAIGERRIVRIAGVVCEDYDVEDAPVERRLIPKTVIIDRLQQVGKLTAARAALDGAELYLQERWNSRTAIYADDPSAIALLQAIGADPAVILAAE